MCPSVHSSTIGNSQDLNNLKVHQQKTGSRRCKTYIHTHTYHISYITVMYYIHIYTPTHKNNEIVPFTTTWVDLENVILNKIRQVEKDKHGMTWPVCGKQKLIQMNLYTKQKQTHTCKKKKKQINLERKGEGKYAIKTQMTVHKIGKKQGFIAQHREVYPKSYNSL